MKKFLAILGLGVAALFQLSCSTNNSPSGTSPTNHNYPYSGTIGSGGSGASQYIGPTGVVVLRSAIFVADYSGSKILKYDLNGNFLAGYTGFTLPYAIAADSTGILYVTTNPGGSNMIQTIDQNGNSMGAWGSVGTALGQYSVSIRGIAVDSSDRVYVADRNNNRIERCSNTGTGCVTLGGTAFGSGNGQFNGPYGVSIDKNGNVWVADSSNSRIQEFDSSLNFVQAFSTPGAAPTDVRMDQDGNLILVDQVTYNIQKVTASGSFLQLIGSGWTLPYSTAFDSNNNLYVADAALPAIKVFTPN